ncbi:MAG: superoxide dismutase family protein [Pseudomonadota bacterium]
MSTNGLARLIVASAFCLSACATLSPAKPGATATLESRSGSMVTGTATFTAGREGLVLHVVLQGLPPGSEHGLHIHDKGDCTAPDAMSAGGHFNPAGAVHGRPGLGAHHLGDLGAVVADSEGKVAAEISLSELTLAAGPQTVVGHSLVVHRDRDDYVSQPAGNAGPRVACGVIAVR